MVGRRAAGPKAFPAPGPYTVCVCSQCVFRTCTGPWLLACGRRLTSVPCGQAFPCIPRTGHAKLQATRHARPFTLPHCTNSHFFAVHFLQKCFQVLRPESGLRLLRFFPFTPRTSQRASLCKEAHGLWNTLRGQSPARPLLCPWARLLTCPRPRAHNPRSITRADAIEARSHVTEGEKALLGRLRSQEYLRYRRRRRRARPASVRPTRRNASSAGQKLDLAC